MTLLITIYFINIVLYFITFSWIVLLEKNKCNCCLNWKRDFMKYFLIFMVFFIFAGFLINIHDYLKYSILILQIVYIGIVFIYIRDLMRKHCDCGNQEDMNKSKHKYAFYSQLDGIIIVMTLILFVLWKR